jgi:predicted TIM-barrel enzyme
MVGTTFKRDGYVWNEVEQARVAHFTERIGEVRDGPEAWWYGAW